LLILTKFEDANQELIKSSIDISSTIQSVHQSMEARASAKKITYKKNIVKNIILESNEQVVSQLTMILIDNAIKYTPENETVFVSLSERNRRVVLRVVNSGNPISQEKIPYLFDRFYRGDSSRNSENSGYGLGLAIAKAITETINAEIIVNVSPDGINHFEVHF
jgi:signal transduction histidine kinase